MKKIIIAAMVVAAATTSAATSRQSVVMGVAVNSAGHGVVVGEPVVGMAGAQGDWHVTHGQLQGIANVRVNDPTSLSDCITALGAYTVFPNPVRDLMNVSCPDGKKHLLSVTSLDGITMIAMPMTQVVSTIDMSNLTPGIYIVNISSADGTPSFITKIIKY
ncbi:MAG: T9SS type A sorting domain-containing protein [Pseudoflavonifractor sp.]|nr:T9SS type A sorting domain-containing protein [Pseudoflavonifractor sp.]